MRIAVTRGVALLVACLALLGAWPAPAWGQSDPIQTTVQVPIAAVGATDIEGLALLSPVETGGTAIQVLVTGAPEGSVAVIHPGSCDTWDPQPVALLGDVGVGNSLQVTVPIGIETLADGAHVLVLHEGFDLASGLGCGGIPRTQAPPRPSSDTSTASPPPAPASTAYTSPRFGFSVTWDETWQEIGGAPPEGVDRVSLQHGPSTLDIAGYRLEGGDAATCVAAWEDDLFAGVREGRVANLAPLLDADGARIAGGDAGHAWAAYGYSLESATKETADYRECWSLPDSGLVEVGYATWVSDYAAEAAARDAVLATLVLPEAPVPPSTAPEPAASTAPEPVPSTAPVPVASPVATTDPRCGGVPAWVEATRGRLDRIVDLQAEADAFIGEGDANGYIASVGAFAGEVRALLAQQESDLVPDLALSANETATATLSHYIEAGETLYRHITVAASPGLYQRFVDQIQAANEGAGKLRTQLGDLEGRCP